MIPIKDARRADARALSYLISLKIRSKLTHPSYADGRLMRVNDV